MNTQAQQNIEGKQDSAKLWRVEVFGGLELLRARFGEFCFSPHTHEEYMIGVTESGFALPYFGGRTHQVGRGDIFALSPGEVHGGGPAAESLWCYRSFYISVALMQRIVRELTGSNQRIPGFVKDVISDLAVATRLRQAHMALEEPDSTLASETHLLETFAFLVARHAVDKMPTQQIGNEHRAVKIAKAYLEALSSENLSLETLSRETGISPFHLCRVFRRDTGLPPHAYQILVRVRHAKTLLMEGIPITQAALEAGFYDQAHLTRHFKRVYGVTPGQYLGGVLPPAS